jgi:hypothetical protein
VSVWSFPPFAADADLVTEKRKIPKNTAKTTTGMWEKMRDFSRNLSRVCHSAGSFLHACISFSMSANGSSSCCNPPFALSFELLFLVITGSSLLGGTGWKMTDTCDKIRQWERIDGNFCRLTRRLHFWVAHSVTTDVCVLCLFSECDYDCQHKLNIVWTSKRCSKRVNTENTFTNRKFSPLFS